MGCGAVEATGLGCVCFVVLNPHVLSNRVDLGCFIQFPILLPRIGHQCDGAYLQGSSWSRRNSLIFINPRVVQGNQWWWWWWWSIGLPGLIYVCMVFCFSVCHPLLKGCNQYPRLKRGSSTWESHVMKCSQIKGIVSGKFTPWLKMCRLVSQ